MYYNGRSDEKTRTLPVSWFVKAASVLYNAHIHGESVAVMINSTTCALLLVFHHRSSVIIMFVQSGSVCRSCLIAIYVYVLFTFYSTL